MNKQEPVEFNSRLDKDPDKLEKLDYLVLEELIESNNLLMHDIDLMFIEHVIKESARFISDDMYFISTQSLNLDYLKTQALSQMSKRCGLLAKKVHQDRVTCSFFSGINQATSTSVSIPIYITVTFITEIK